MKIRKRENKAYDRLIRRIVMQLCAVVAASALGIVLLREALRGKVANWIVDTICRFGKLDWYDAQSLYWNLILKHLELIMGAAIMLVFLILFHFTRTWFTRYFDEMVKGVDKLASGTDEEIQMCEELSFMEDELNEVRRKLKKRTEEAKAAEQRKNDLVVYLAHDIKTPLTSVIGYLSLLEEAPDMSAEQKAKYMHIALDKAYRLERLINEFFEITRYNLQQIHLETETIDLSYMLVQMADEFYPILKAHGNTIEIKAKEDLHVHADAMKLARVFNNILKNAVAYSYPGSVIKIVAESTEKEVRILFQNKGKTISKQKLDMLFEKFFRLDDARATNTGGAGLGLAIAKEIVALHGGTIAADSEEEMTTFTVTLPI